MFAAKPQTPRPTGDEGKRVPSGHLGIAESDPQSGSEASRQTAVQPTTMSDGKAGRYDHNRRVATLRYHPEKSAFGHAMVHKKYTVVRRALVSVPDLVPQVSLPYALVVQKRLARVLQGDAAGLHHVP